LLLAHSVFGGTRHAEKRLSGGRGDHSVPGCDPAHAHGQLGRPPGVAKSGSRGVCRDLLPSDGGALVAAALAHPNRIAALRHGGTVCIAAASLIAADPVLGLLGSTTFVVVSAFTVVFHGGGLLAFTWSIGAATLGVLAVRLGGIDSAVAN